MHRLLPVLFLGLALAAASCSSSRSDSARSTATSDGKASVMASSSSVGDLVPKERTMEFSYETTLKEIPAGTRVLDVWVPAPEKAPPIQQVISESMKADQPGAVVTPYEKGGNRWWHVRIPDPKPPVTLVATMTVRRLEHMNNYFRGAGTKELSAEQRAQMREELGPYEMVPVGGRFDGLATAAAHDEKNTVNAARKIYDHVLESMRYSKDGTGWGRGDSNWACDSGFGNCTDFHSVFMSMAKSRGIPARFHMGFPIPEQHGAGAVAGYHCWAEFFVPDMGWVPVDISEADKHPELAQYYFGALTEDRIAFTTGRDLVLEPMPATGKRNFFIYPLAEADGKEIKAERAFKYRDM